MGDPAKLTKDDATKEAGSEGVPDAALVALAGQWPFGPAFFLSQLSAFVRDGCADPKQGLPVVEVHLADGDVLDLCHVIGIAPVWIALAVNNLDAKEGEPAMRTELVAYARIVRITVSGPRTDAPRIGFLHDHVPSVMGDARLPPSTPEAALRTTAGIRPHGSGGAEPAVRL